MAVAALSVIQCVVFLENREQFWWFGHTYGHTKAHQFSNLDAIIDDMLHNQAFAQVMYHS